MKRTLAVRAEMLEATVSRLSELPGQFKELSAQFVQLGDDVRGEISAIRGELNSRSVELRDEMGTVRDELRGEMGTARDELRGEMGDMHRDLAKAILSSEDRVVSQMRLLHEDVIKRITLLRDTPQPVTAHRQPPSRKRR